MNFSISLTESEVKVCEECNNFNKQYFFFNADHGRWRAICGNEKCSIIHKRFPEVSPAMDRAREKGKWDRLHPENGQVQTKIPNPPPRGNK